VTTNPENSGSQEVSNKEAAEWRSAALKGAQSVAGLARDEYDECANEGVEAVLRGKPANPCAYAYKAARFAALDRVQRQKRPLGPLRAGKRKQRIRLGPDDLERIGRIRRNLISYCANMIGKYGMVRRDEVASLIARRIVGELGELASRQLKATPDAESVAVTLGAFISKKIRLGSDGWSESEATRSATFSVPGAKPTKWRPERAHFKNMRRAASALIVDTALRKCGFNSLEVHWTERVAAARHAREMKKWAGRLKDAATRAERSEPIRHPAFRRSGPRAK
jgi:hypothetical protein